MNEFPLPSLVLAVIGHWHMWRITQGFDALSLYVTSETVGLNRFSKTNITDWKKR